jgi:nucleoside-diphosphate-sugar epimerase
VGSFSTFFLWDVLADLSSLPAIFAWSLICTSRIIANYFYSPSTFSVAQDIPRDEKSILVTGGAGYIGSELVQQLLDDGWDVTVLDLGMFGYGSLSHHELNEKFRLIKGDALNVGTLSHAIRDRSVVVHLAGLVGDPACAVDEDFTMIMNDLSARVVKDACLSHGISKLIFASSCSVYGFSNKIVNEDSYLTPVSLYAKSKINTEEDLKRIRNDSLSVTILRFATVYGHSMRPRFDLVTNLFTAKAFNCEKIEVFGTQQWRPFIHVKDIARAICLVAEEQTDRTKNQTYNVGGDSENYTINDIAKIVSDQTASLLGVRPLVEITNQDTDPRSYEVSFKKIKQDLGFEPVWTVEDGVKEMLTAFVNGEYDDYRNTQHSNVATTKAELWKRRRA